MEVGVKLWSNDKDNLEDYSFADFMEVMAVPGTSVERFKSYDYKYTIHAPHARFGVNIANKSIEKRNIELLKWAVKAADELNAEIIVVHAGFTDNESRIKEAIDNMKRFFAGFRDERFHLENILLIEEEKVGAGSTAEQIAQVTKPFKMRFCLDFGHAIGAANHLGKDYKEFVKDFLKLKPNYFHVSGTDTTKAMDGHLSLFEGNLDIEWVKGIIRKHNKPVCLETPMDTEQRKREVELMKS